MSLSIINPFVFATGGGGGDPDTYGVAGFTSPGSAYGGSFRVGWRFTVGASNLEARSLRHYGSPNSGVYRVMIHRDSDEAVMASADITKVVGDWAEEAITPVTLAAGVTYTISAAYVSGSARGVYRNTNGLSYASEITVNHNRLFGDEDDTRPDLTASNWYVLPADFGFVVL